MVETLHDAPEAPSPGRRLVVVVFSASTIVVAAVALLFTARVTWVAVEARPIVEYFEATYGEGFVHDSATFTAARECLEGPVRADGEPARCEATPSGDPIDAVLFYRPGLASITWTTWLVLAVSVALARGSHIERWLYGSAVAVGIGLVVPHVLYWHVIDVVSALVD